MNCPERFPMTKVNRKFCSDKCRLEYHRYGAAYGPLRDKLTKLIDETIADRYKQDIATLERRVAQLEDIHFRELGEPQRT